MNTNIKKLSLVLVALFGLQGCQSALEADLDQSQTHKSVLSEKDVEVYLRTPAEAKEILSQFLEEHTELRSINGATRSIGEVLDLSNYSELRATSTLSDFSRNFYVVTFKEGQGYAMVSRDKRCFPVYAILDTGEFDAKNLRNADMSRNVMNMVKGYKSEIKSYNKALEMLSKRTELRGNNDNPWENTENAEQNMLNEGWSISRSTPIRLNTTWRQKIKEGYNFCIDKNGVSYEKAYGRNGNNERNTFSTLRTLSAKEASVFGCTPVAFGQVMYALRDFPGFNTLTYTNGERVLWENMSLRNSLAIENQRFLGWITANSNPTYFDAGTMVFNIDATKFLRSKLGGYFASRYDNCVAGEGDFDGYGWAEDRRVAEDFFNHPHAFVIMTASSGALNYWSYHTFVIDGMIEFKKRIKDSGWFGWGWFNKWRDGIRHLYHVNAGWAGASNGYYLYVQNVDDEFEYTGSNNAMDYRSKPAYLILWPYADN